MGKWELRTLGEYEAGSLIEWHYVLQELCSSGVTIKPHPCKTLAGELLSLRAAMRRLNISPTDVDGLEDD